MSNENLIQRCKECDYCSFEDMLTEEQRNISVLKNPIPDRHIHREVVEQICGRHYDQVCVMKYAVERVPSNDENAIQIACVGIYRWDLGKQLQKAVKIPEAFISWGNPRDLGRGVKESLAERFREIWRLGLREKEHQSISVRNIYEIVVSTPKTYEGGVNFYKQLREEYLLRDQCKIKI